MSFLHPALFVAGALCVSIPIIIHLLLRQRRKPIRWGAMRFLLEAYRKQRRKLKLQQWILLATRCLILLLLALALGRPLLEQAGLLGGAAGQTLYLLIDNSMASSVRDLRGGGADPTALERHKEEAIALLRELGPGDRAGLIALGAPAQPIVAPASSDLAAIERWVREIEPTDGPADVRGALETLSAEIDTEESEPDQRFVVALLSDFLLGSVDVSRPLPPALEQAPNLRLIASSPAATAPGNVQIVGIDPLRRVVLTGGVTSGRHGRENVRVHLRRSGPLVKEPGITSVRLRVRASESGRELPGVQSAVRWEPGADTATVTMQVDPTVAGAESDLDSSVLIAEIDRDAIASDNIHRRPIRLREALRVGVIGRPRFTSIAQSLDQLGPADWIRLALKPSRAAPIDLVDIDPSSIDAPTLASIDVAFAAAPDLIESADWSRLRTFVDAGGLLIVNPAHDTTVHLWSDDFEQAMDLGWRIEREPSELSESEGQLDDRPGESPVLEVLEQEVGDLVEAVTVQRVLGVEEIPAAADVLLRLRSGAPWLIAQAPGQAAASGDERPGNGAHEQQQTRGLVIYLASAPAQGWTNLQWSSLMVPLVQELALQGYGQSIGDWTSLAGRRAAAPPRAARLVSLEHNDGGDRELELGERDLTASAVRRAGLWEAHDEAGRPRGFVAVNADPDAGRMTIQDPSSVRRWLLGARGAESQGESVESTFAFLDESDPGSVFASQDADSPLSLPLLLGALALALCEVLMARWFSHAQVERPVRGAAEMGVPA